MKILKLLGKILLASGCLAASVLVAAICAIPVCANAVDMPEAEASVSFHSMKVERGMCENHDPIFGLEAELGWHGTYAGIEALYDITDANGRRGKYNEITPFAGYRYALRAWLEAGAEYHFKQGPSEHTHEIELFVECPLRFATPFASWNIDLDRDAGALYGVVGAEREIELGKRIAMNLDAGFGYGNARRNNADFDRNAVGARDIHVGLECRCKLCEHLRLCPYCRFYQQFTEAAREEYNGGFFVDAGCALVAKF